MALELDGLGVINIGEPIVLDQDFSAITLSCWIKHSTGDVSPTDYILGKGSMWYLMFNNPTICKFRHLNLGIANTSVTVPAIGTSWHFIVATYNGSRTNIYLNGVDYDGNTGLSGGLGTNDVNVGIGSYFGDTPFWKGSIDEVRIYNRALSEAEIKILYNSRGQNIITKGLVGYWRMNEKPDGTAASGANSIIDLSGYGNHGTPEGGPIYRATPNKIYIPRVIA